MKGPTKHCPLCGRGLSQKYQVAPHARLLGNRKRRSVFALRARAYWMCRWNGFATRLFDV